MGLSFAVSITIFSMTWQVSDGVCLNPAMGDFECGLDGFTSPLAQPPDPVSPIWHRANHIDYGPPVDGSYFMDFVFSEADDTSLTSPLVSCPNTSNVCLSFDFVINKYGPELIVLTKCGKQDWKTEASYNDETEPRKWEHRNFTISSCPDEIYQVALKGDAPPYSYDGLAVDNVYIGDCAGEPRGLLDITTQRLPCVTVPTAETLNATSTSQPTKTPTTSTSTTIAELSSAQSSKSHSISPTRNANVTTGIPSASQSSTTQSVNATSSFPPTFTTQTSISGEPTSVHYSSSITVPKTKISTTSMSTAIAELSSGQSSKATTMSSTRNPNGTTKIPSTQSSEPTRDMRSSSVPETSSHTVSKATPRSSASSPARSNTTTSFPITPSHNSQPVTRLHSSSTTAAHKNNSNVTGFTLAPNTDTKNKTDLIVGCSLGAAVITVLVVVLVVRYQRRRCQAHNDIMMNDLAHIVRACDAVM